MEIYEFRKNAVEKVKVSLVQYRGYDLIDIRVYYDNGDGKFMPTRKGLCISLELLPDLLEGISKAKIKVESTG